MSVGVSYRSGPHLPGWSTVPTVQTSGVLARERFSNKKPLTVPTLTLLGPPEDPEGRELYDERPFGGK